VHDLFLLGRQEVDVSGRPGRLREAGRIAVGAAEAYGQFQRIELQAAVRDAFTLLLLAQERESAIDGGIRELAQILEVLRIREAEGEGSQYDRMRGQRALVELEADRGAAAALKAEARGRLAGYFGSDDGLDLIATGALDIPGAPATVAALLERALTGRGDYRALQMSAEQFRVEQDAANRLAMPTPTLTGGLKRSGTDNRDHSGYLFSVDLTIPLFNRGGPTAAIANAQRTAAEAEASALRLRIEAELRAAHAALVIQRERAERYRAATLETTETLVKVARVGYEEGELGILELLDAVRQSLDGRLRLLELMTATRRAAIELDRVAGTEIKP
jgi:cobalt-zinc-cadmium efflux system outer membrane protein